MHPATLPDEQLLRECDVTRTRRSGPGGQHRNKVETAVILIHRPTGVSAEANERRSQAENQVVALFRLRLKLAVEVRVPVDVSAGEGPSDTWRERCPHGRVAINPQHRDFPSLLSEALDFLAASDWDCSRAATALGCSTSQLMKLLQHEPPAWGLLNAQRQRLGLHPLKPR